MFDFLIAGLLGAGAAYYGHKKNEEAKERNQQAKQLINQCNEYIDNAKQYIEVNSNYIQSVIDDFGKRKHKFLVDIIKPSLNMLDDIFAIKSTNLDTTLNIQNIKLRSVSSILSEIDALQFRVNNYMAVYSTNFAQSRDNTILDTIIASLGAFGVCATISSIATGGLATFSLGGLSLINALPLSIGAGYGLVGFLNDYKSKQNAQTALDYLEKVKALEPEITKTVKFIESYENQLINELNNVISLSNKYRTECSEIIDMLHYYEGMEFDVPKERILAVMPLEFQSKVADLILHAKIMYEILDVPLLSNDKKLLKTSLDKIKKIGMAYE